MHYIYMMLLLTNTSSPLAPVIQLPLTSIWDIGSCEKMADKMTTSDPNAYNKYACVPLLDVDSAKPIEWKIKTSKTEQVVTTVIEKDK